MNPPKRRTIHNFAQKKHSSTSNNITQPARGMYLSRKYGGIKKAWYNASETRKYKCKHKGGITQLTQRLTYT